MTLKKREKDLGFLSYEVVECPKMLFFLDDYFFEHTSCCGVAAFECFSDDLSIERNCAAFQCMVKN